MKKLQIIALFCVLVLALTLNAFFSTIEGLENEVNYNPLPPTFSTFLSDVDGGFLTKSTWKFNNKDVSESDNMTFSYAYANQGIYKPTTPWLQIQEDAKKAQSGRE